MINLSRGTLKTEALKQRYTYLISAMIMLLFVAVVSFFDGIAFQLLVFALGLTLLGWALIKNFPRVTAPTHISAEKIRVKVESFFPNVSIAYIQRWETKEGYEAVLLQIEGKDAGHEYIQSKIIRNYIKNNFEAAEVVVELL